MESKIKCNARDLERELSWFAEVLDKRFELYFQQEVECRSIFEIAPPELEEPSSSYAQFVLHYDLKFSERLALALSIAPHIRPQLLDIFFTKNKKFDRKFSEFGGLLWGTTGDFLPTGETLVFLLAANDLEVRFTVQALFDPQHIFAKHNILRLDPIDSTTSPHSKYGESSLKAPLRLSGECLSFFTTGEPRRPDFGPGFPARYIETGLTWEDLVLHPSTREQVEEIETWLQHGEMLLNDWGMAPKIRPGYRSLFYGPPGTGKTMTACLLGKATGRDVYIVDLSLVVSKYIGETEKSLARVFDCAQHKGWILFFDEADALFGKRTETRDAHDRYANQEVSFLLQRIEAFDGVVILASNMPENLDKAFTRRFESTIYFPVPRPEERLAIWRQGFPTKAKLEASLDLKELAHHYTLSGGSIMNAIRYASLQALKDGGHIITADSVLKGIRREHTKEGKMA